MELTITHIFAILALTSLLLAVLGIGLAVYSLIEVKSLQRSTHQVQFMPVDEAIDRENQDFINSLQTRDMEPEVSHRDMWATTDESLKKQNELYRDDLERTMPEFVDDDEPEILSF
jgi:uncharacterized protein YqhQ